jgi:hypothetical protein
MKVIMIFEKKKIFFYFTVFVSILLVDLKKHSNKHAHGE